jgi:hypothetical protein
MSSIWPSNSFTSAFSASAVVGALRAVGRLHRQLADALQDVCRLAQRAFRRLHEADAVLRVALGDACAAYLRTEILGNRQAGGVIGGPVDAKAAGKALQAPVQVPVERRRTRDVFSAATLVLMRSPMMYSSVSGWFCASLRYH